MRIKVRCTGRADNYDNQGKDVWTYAFLAVSNPGQPVDISIEFKINSKKPLHIKKGEILDLKLDSHSGIEVVSTMTQ